MSFVRTSEHTYVLYARSLDQQPFRDFRFFFSQQAQLQLDSFFLRGYCCISSRRARKREPAGESMTANAAAAAAAAEIFGDLTVKVVRGVDLQVSLPP